MIDIGERFLLPGLLIALTAVDDRWQLRRFGAVLACAEPLTLLWMLAILPSVPHRLDIRSSEVVDTSRRSALLFWHSLSRSAGRASPPRRLRGLACRRRASWSS